MSYLRYTIEKNRKPSPYYVLTYETVAHSKNYLVSYLASSWDDIIKECSRIHKEGNYKRVKGGL